MKYGVLFDFNGTLFRDSDKHETAWRQFAAQYANRPISDEEFELHIHGNHNDKAISYLFNSQLSDEEIEHYSAEKEQIYRELCLSDMKSFVLIKGVSEFLTDLKELQVPMTIATASGKENVDFYFDHFELGKWFDYDKVVYNNGDIKSKPDPDPYLKAAQRLQMKATECIVFEDSISGIRSAEAANAKGIVAVSTNDNQEKLAQITSVTKVIDDFTQINYENLLLNERL